MQTNVDQSGRRPEAFERQSRALTIGCKNDGSPGTRESMVQNCAITDLTIGAVLTKLAVAHDVQLIDVEGQIPYIDHQMWCHALSDLSHSCAH